MNSSVKKLNDENKKLPSEVHFEDEVSRKKVKKSSDGYWYHFEILTPNSAILRGTYSMNSPHFKQRSRGHQAASSSVVAIVFGRLFEIKHWTRNYIDRILEYGDKLFRISATRNRVNPGVYLTTSLVYPEFYVEDYKCLVCTEESNVYGNLFSASIGCPDFNEGFQRFFKHNDSAVITAQGISVAVWRLPLTGDYVYYDPSPCDDNGTRTKDGAACAMRFKNIDEMAELYLGNLDRRYDSRYCIDRVSVLRVTPINRGVIMADQLRVDKNTLRALNPVDLEDNKQDCTRPAPKRKKTTVTAGSIDRVPLTITISNYDIDTRLATEPLINLKSLDTEYPYYDMEANVPSTFKEIPGKMAILHGWTHESSEMYKGKGAQNVANCVVAIAMKRVSPVKTWLRPRLDDILVHGDALYARIKAEKPTIKTMTAADLDDTSIKIDDRSMFIDVDLLTIVGTISSKIPGVLSLKQALEEFFLVNKDGVLECSSMALAIWTQDDYYYAFDPRQCDAMGTRIIEEKGKSGKGKKDAGTMEKKVKGKCCVVRHADLESLVAMFLRNIDQTRKNDRFVIHNITIIDEAPGVREWKEFQPGEAGKTWILRGGMSNRDENFENSGLQGMAMPIVGLVNAKETPPDKWTRETIDQAIKDGDEYYNWCVPAEEEENRDLNVGNLKKTLYVKKRRVKIDIQEASIVGNLSASDEDKMPNLTRGLRQFFETREYGIVEANDLSVAVWKFDEEQKDKTKKTFYYLYDANPRDNIGKKTDTDIENSKACVVRVSDLGELARLFETNVDREIGNDFAIHEVKVTSIGEPMTDEEIETDKTIPSKPDLNAYTEIGEDGGCLNGSYDQSNETIFKQQTRDKQQAANALVTLAMRKLYNPHLWYREVIDDILKIGDRLTLKNIGNLPTNEEEDEDEEEQIVGAVKRDYLLPSEIGEEFDIGVNRETVTIEEESSIGPVTELTKNLEEFFAENTMGIFRQDSTIMPIWKEGDVYFTMDPRGRDNLGNPKDKDGTATVLWFTGIPSLAASLQLSLSKADGDFVIDAVTLSNAYESRVNEAERLPKTTSTEDLWHRFPKKSDGMWELEGNIGIDDERFDADNRNKQTAAVAVMAVIFSKVYEPRQWSKEILDEVIVSGDKLHTRCLERLGKIPRVNDMTKEFFLSTRRIDLTIEDSVEAGNMTGREPKIQDLRKGIERFFKDYASGALTLDNSVNIAIWKHDDHYYALVPFEAYRGHFDSSGKSRILRFASNDNMADYLRSLMDNDEADWLITSIDVVDWDTKPPWKLDPSPAVKPSILPPLNAYRKLPGLEGEARAILRASVHQGSDIFSDKIRNRQTAANCVVALAMSVLRNPAMWTRNTMDEILVVGTRVHRESLKAHGGKMEKFKPCEIVRVFNVGVTVMVADVEDSTLRGIVAVAPPEPEVKGKGKEKKKKAPKAKKAKKGKTKRTPPPPPAPIYLEEGLPKFFANNGAGVLRTGRYMTAIWRHRGVYFMYDPRSRDEHGRTTDYGTSCVMWFACIEPLYSLIFDNIDADEKYGNYEISRVIVRTSIIEALPCPAGFRTILRCNVPRVPTGPKNKMADSGHLDIELMTEYRIVDDDIAILRGTRHIDDRQFNTENRGFQSTAVSAIAIVVSAIHVPSIWSSEIVDAILKYGDLLHTDSARVVRPGPRNLSPIELLTTFVIGDFRSTIDIHYHTHAGILHTDDLAQSMKLFFRHNCAGILHTGNNAVPIMQHYGKFYLLDPLARNDLGRSSHDGSACVVKCRSIERLAWHYVNNCNYKEANVYTINTVNLMDLRFYGDTRSECPNFCDKK